MDKTVPTLTAKTEVIEITEGDNNEVSSYFNISYGISGGSISCTPTNTSNLAVGNQTVSCTATSNSGLTTTATKVITIKSSLPDSISFASDSWSTISELVKAGVAGDYYSVGDTKEVEVSGYGTFTVRIANMSTPNECSSSSFSQTACGFVIEFVDIITTYNMNPSNTNVGGYPASAMYNFINDGIYNALPNDLKNIIINTSVVSSHGSNDSSNFTTTNKLYLLATKEIWGKSGSRDVVEYDTSDNNTRQLDYYEYNGVSTSNYRGAIKNYNGSVTRWWLRSATSIYDYRFYYVGTNGFWDYLNASYLYGVAPAFRIG